MSMSVCLSVRLREVENNTGELRQIFAHVARGRSSVLLLRRCDTLCTSGFADDVIFLYDSPMVML